MIGAQKSGACKDVRVAILFMATLLPGLGLLSIIASATDIFEKGGPIERWQTLIAGAVALLAAAITVQPVWRQLDRMGVQTNTVFREFLQERLRNTTLRRKWLDDHLQKFRNEVGQRLNEMQELDGGKINIHWVFERAQITGTLVSDLRRYQIERRDPVEIENCINDVIEALVVLEARCDTIHRTHSSDQSGEDWSISDEDWAGMKAAGIEAEGLVGSDALAVNQAVDCLEERFEEEQRSLRERLRRVDQALLKSKS